MQDIANRKSWYTTQLYIGVFLLTVILAVAVLFVASFLPQRAIDKNVRESAEIMNEEGLYPLLFDKSYGSRLDNFTDATMILESKAMSNDQIDSIWSNPRFTIEGKNPVESLYGYTHNTEDGYFYYYCKYWMGFRASLRLLFTFFNYYQVKRYLAFSFMALFALLICQMTKEVDSKIATMFAFSILLVRPHVLCGSLQFSCCFLIAFISMLAVPWIHRNPKWEGVFFLELGMLTMYFDFYTTPLITFGLPMCYLMLLSAKGENNIYVKRILKNLLVWLVSYGMMWIVKLVLTDIFTSQNALKRGLRSMFRWIGVAGYEKDGASYDILKTFERLWQVITSADKEGEKIVILTCLLVVTFIAVSIICKKIAWNVCKRNIGFLVLAILPIVWFIITAEPVRVHFWFQYRSIVLFYWALGAYLCLIFAPKSIDSEKNV